MIEMAFHIEGGGYAGFSGGSVWLAFKYHGERLLYSSACQGTSSSCFTSSSPFQITNSVTGAGDGVLFNFSDVYVADVTVPDSVAAGGTVTFTFKVTEPKENTLRYQVERKVDIRGISAGSVSITTRLKKLDLVGLGGHMSQWERIWNGDIRPVA